MPAVLCGTVGTFSAAEGVSRGETVGCRVLLVHCKAGKRHVP